MNIFNIKSCIIVLLMRCLVLENVKGSPNLCQRFCIHTIKKYFQVNLDFTPKIKVYAIYGMKHIRVSKETLSGIEIFPSDVGRPENIPQSRQGPTPNVAPKIVTNLNDLMGNLIGNTAETKNNSSSQNNINYELNPINKDSSQRVCSEGEIPKEIIVDYFNIPETVSMYYLALIPYLKNKAYFQKPMQYCSKIEEKAKINACLSQIFESFHTSAIEFKNLSHKEIIVFMYQHYVIGDLFSKSQEFAIKYLEYVARNTKLQDITPEDKVPSAARFCEEWQKKYHPDELP